MTAKVVAMSTTISVLHIPCVDHRHSGRLQCMMRARNLTVTQEAKVEVGESGLIHLIPKMFE